MAMDWKRATATKCKVKPETGPETEKRCWWKTGGILIDSVV